MMDTAAPSRPDASMTLITEMMERPLDPGYAAAAERRRQAGLPAASGLRSPTLIIATILIGALLGSSALALRAPTTAASQIKLSLVARIESARAHADSQTGRITTARNEINAAQATALSQQRQSGLTSELSKLEAASFYEERLLFLLIRLRNPQSRMVYVTSQPVHPLILDYYFQLLAGIPASGIGTVKKSLRYISSGSSVLAPSSKATEGEVGVTTKSNSANAVAKSSAIFVRTRWARP